MESHVGFEVAAAVEAFIADVAFVGLFSCKSLPFSIIKIFLEEKKF